MASAARKIEAGAARRSSNLVGTGRKRDNPQQALRVIFEDLVLDRSETGILSFCKHAGIALPEDGEAWWPTFMAHYLRGKDIDHGHVCQDLASWPPIVRRVREIQAEIRRHG